MGGHCKHCEGLAAETGRHARLSQAKRHWISSMRRNLEDAPASRWEVGSEVVHLYLEAAKAQLQSEPGAESIRHSWKSHKGCPVLVLFVLIVFCGGVVALCLDETMG